jgi:hypothetical protein
MSTIATALKHMLAAGMPHDAIVSAVAEMEAATPAALDPVAERRREYDRMRKREERAAARMSAESGGRQVDSADKADAEAFPYPPNDNNSNPPTPTQEDITPRVKADAHVAAWWGYRVKNPFPRPYWATTSLWAAFLKVRKAKTLVNTDAAHDRLLRDMAKLVAQTGWPPGEIFRACVEKGWGAIYETDEMKAETNGNSGNRRSSRSGSSGSSGKQDGLAAACMDDLAAHEARRSGVDGTGNHRRLGAPSAAPL